MDGGINKKPNVLLIMSDQMRYDALACNGNKSILTANLDKLASEGVNFSNAFTPDPICVPARACLTTGLYPHKCTGVKDNHGSIKGGLPLLGDEFNKRGYDTYAVGKMHYLPYKGPNEKRTTHGFKTVELAESGRILKKFDPAGELSGLEDYLDYLKTVGWGGYSRANGLGNNDIFTSVSIIPQEYFVDTWVADRTIDHLTNHLRNKNDIPFFMFCSFPKPHSAFDPPRPYDSMYDPRNMKLPIGDISLLKERGTDQFYRRHFEYEWDDISPEAQKTIKAYYYGLVSHQDEQIGRVIDYINNNDIRENTIIVYTSDHGEMLGDFGLYHKEVFYNGSVSIPLIISYPDKLPQNKTCDELAGLQDILPTLISFTGIPLDRIIDGMDLSNAIENDIAVREYYISQCNDDPRQQYMVCGKDWKYIYHQDGGVEELYDRKQDPDELINLANIEDNRYKEIKGKMKDYLIKWCVDNNDLGMIYNDDLVKGPQMEKYRRSKIEKIYGRRYY